MKKISYRTFIVFALLLFAPILAAAQSIGPKSAVATFYRFDLTHPQVFNRKNIDARKKWFSPELYKLFLRELSRQKEFLAAHPDEKPYFGDGLPFRPYDEVCREGRKSLHKRTTFGSAMIEGNTATFPVTFAFPKPCKDPDATVYTLKLVRSGSAWLIDDVRYSETANLVSNLSRVDY